MITIQVLAVEMFLVQLLSVLKYVEMVEIWGDGNVMTVMSVLEMGILFHTNTEYRCSHTCTVETGWFCIGGGAVTADVCTETCGDAIDWDTLPCEDGVLNSGG